MFDRVSAALKATNLFKDYMKKFQDEKLTDYAVTICLKNPLKWITLLKKVIPVDGDREKFVSEFLKPTTTQKQQHEQRKRRRISKSPELIILDEEEESGNSNTPSSATTASTTRVKIEPTLSTSTFTSFSAQNSTTTTTDFTSLINTSYEKAIQLYTTNMNDLFSTPDFFLDESALCEKHQENRSKTIEQFSSAYKKYKNSMSQVEIKLEDRKMRNVFIKMDKENEENFNVKMSDCHDEIDKKFEEYKEKNQLKKSNYIYKARNFVREAEKLYIDKMEKSIDSCTEEEENEDELKEKEKQVNEQVTKYLNENVQNPQANSKFIDELNQELQNSMKKWFDNHLKSFQLRREENEMAVNRAFDTVKNYYNEQMEKEFNSQNFIEPLKLVEIDQKISEATLKMWKEKNPNLKLTLSQEKQIDDCLKILYKKYEDKNLLKKPSSSPAIGIDLGTTNSCVAVYRNGKVEVLFNENGNRTTPSFVCFQDHESVVVGDVAKEKSFRNPQNTIFDSKRLIGRNFDDEKVQENIKTWSFGVINENNKPKIQIGLKKPEHSVSLTKGGEQTSSSNEIGDAHCKTYHPEEISALILRKMKKIAEDVLQVEVKDAVITVPALFNDYQRQATKDAGEIAGLNVLRIINEPTAAAIAYNLHRKDDLKRNVLVFDLGGGTLDVVVLEILKGEISVKSVHGDTHLGGQDLDNEMIKYCIEHFKKQHGIDLARDQNSSISTTRSDSSSRLRRIRNECEIQKKVLSSTIKTDVGIEAIEIDPKFLNLDVPFTRALFESLNQKNFDRCLEIVQLALVEAKMSKTEIDDIVLVGGSSRIPKIQKMISDFFDGKVLCKSINPDEAVAEGAAIHACILSGQGFESSGMNGIKLNDVTPFSIGIASREKERRDRFSIIIPKNTVVPCERTHFYSSAVGSRRTRIAIFEGEDPVASKNNLLGEFVLCNLPLKTKKEEEKVNDLRVTMTINKEGILHVRAECVINEESNEILIKVLNHRMTRQEIQDAKATVTSLMK